MNNNNYYLIEFRPWNTEVEAISGMALMTQNGYEEWMIKLTELCYDMYDNNKNFCIVTDFGSSLNFTSEKILRESFIQTALTYPEYEAVYQTLFKQYTKKEDIMIRGFFPYEVIKNYSI